MFMAPFVGAPNVQCTHISSYIAEFQIEDDYSIESSSPHVYSEHVNQNGRLPNNYVSHPGRVVFSYSSMNI